MHFFYIDTFQDIVEQNRRKITCKLSWHQLNFELGSGASESSVYLRALSESYHINLKADDELFFFLTYPRWGLPSLTEAGR